MGSLSSFAYVASPGDVGFTLSEINDDASDDDTGSERSPSKIFIRALGYTVWPDAKGKKTNGIFS